MPAPPADAALRLVAFAGWLALLLGAAPADAFVASRIAAGDPMPVATSGVSAENADIRARIQRATDLMATLAAQYRLASAVEDHRQRAVEAWREPMLHAVLTLHRSGWTKPHATVGIQRLQLLVPTLLSGWHDSEDALTAAAADRKALRQRIKTVMSWRGNLANRVEQLRLSTTASRGWDGRYGQGPSRSGTPPDAAVAFFTPPTSIVDAPIPASARGMPVAGVVVAAFDADDAGGQHRGVIIAPSAVQGVRTPAPGRVVFAGPFKGLGLLLIIEHGDGYHSLISGLREVEVVAGQLVVPGQIVGALQIRDGRPAPLYVELRRHGRPVDPLPWLAGGEEKVSG